MRGSVFASGHFETRGLSHDEVSANLQGHATVHLRNISFGAFDPLNAFARFSGWGALEPIRGPVGMRSAVIALEVHDRQVVLRNASLDLAGAKLGLAGTYSFDGTADLDVRADLRQVLRRWLNHAEDRTLAPPLGNLHLVGPLYRLVASPQIEVSRANQ
jgi:hypothetical protein